MIASLPLARSTSSSSSSSSSSRRRGGGGVAGGGGGGGVSGGEVGARRPVGRARVVVQRQLVGALRVVARGVLLPRAARVPARRRVPRHLLPQPLRGCPAPSSRRPSAGCARRSSTRGSACTVNGVITPLRRREAAAARPRARPPPLRAPARVHHYTITKKKKQPSEIATAADNARAERRAARVIAALDRRDVPGCDTPLHLAARLLRAPTLAAALAVAGADPSLQNAAGWTPLGEAGSRRKLELREFVSMEGSVGDKYRSHLVGEAERNTRWRHGSPPTYDLVNLLFEQERTKRKRCKTLSNLGDGAVAQDPAPGLQIHQSEQFPALRQRRKAADGRGDAGGRQLQRAAPERAAGGAAVLQSGRRDVRVVARGVPDGVPRGFAWEVTQVYAGPPTVVCKFRHWGYMEGPFKGHAPTGEMVQFHGVAVLTVDEELRVEEVEIYYDPGEFLAGLIKGPLLSSTGEVESHVTSTVTATNPTQNTCRFTRSE
uniref:Uncharacterized protein n=1 Tax=Ananas comosus var. bracteatus TaxID=296719 RepID=A0A6V7PTA8_ANACO|nr:unnamed protein product [Ananas comosus var. bracteatus]